MIVPVGMPHWFMKINSEFHYYMVKIR